MKVINGALAFVISVLVFLTAVSCISEFPIQTENAGTTLKFSGKLISGDVKGSIDVNGKHRSFMVHIPLTFNIKLAMPLVIVFHGGGGNAENVAYTTGMSQKADREGFIAVYPNGSSRLRSDSLLTWNSGNCCGYALDNNIDDIGFIRNLIEALETAILIDPQRIYATGISNGGMMSYLMGCSQSISIAAIAPVAGAMGMTSCSPLLPVSVIIFHGTADEHVLYNGGTPLIQADTHTRTDRPVSYAVDFWVKANNCSTVAEKSGSGNIKIDTYRGGKNSTEVALYTIVGGRHAWPGGNPGWAGGDEPTTEISATDIIWDFFRRHPKVK